MGSNAMGKFGNNLRKKKNAKNCTWERCSNFIIIIIIIIIIKYAAYIYIYIYI